MSSFFDDASLVTIPSGYKDGKVYSVKPTSGNGDLTFTRNSDATRVNADGLVEKVRTNSLLQSNSFDTTWLNAATTETGGQAGYDGSNDAWRIDKSNTGAYIIQTISVSGINTFSVYAKAGTLNWIRLNINFTSGTDPIVYFDLANGAIGSTPAGQIDAKIESVGNGWYRCSVAGNGTIQDVRFFPANADNDVSGTSGNIYIQDAQLEQGLVATSYIETTTTAMSEFAGVTASSVADVPRLDYSGGSCPSLLLEPQRTNAITQSEFVDSWSIKTNISIISNNGTSPEGVINASNIYPTTTGASFLYEGSVTYTSGTTYTYSVFAKANGKDYLQITTSGASFSNQYCTFDLALGATDNNGFESVGIEDYGNGWFRCYVVETSISTASSRFVIGLVSNANAGRLSSVTPDGTNGVLIYGVVSEAGSYPTSYIPTYGTTVTRLADACSKTGISSLIGSDAGTIYLEAAALANDLSERRFALSDGTTSNVARVGFTNISNRILAVLYNGSNQCVLTYNGGDITEMNKIAFTWATNDFALFVNGVKRASDVSGSTFAPNTLNALHFNEGDGSGNEMEGKFDQVILFTSRLSDTELENLTA